MVVQSCSFTSSSLRREEKFVIFPNETESKYLVSSDLEVDFYVVSW